MYKWKKLRGLNIWKIGFSRQKWKLVISRTNSFWKFYLCSPLYVESHFTVVPGFPQTFDNWIQGLFKYFQGQQQQFSRIYFKARPGATVAEW